MFLLAHHGMSEPLVMTKVQIGFSAVVSDEDFSMLKRIHGARINIDIRIKLLNRHPQPSAFHQSTDGSSSQTFTQGRKNPTRDENEFWLAQRIIPLRLRFGYS